MLTEAGYAMVRYADDFVILCKTREEAEAALALVQGWVNDNDLTLHPTKTKIADARTEGFDFLGYHFRGDLRVPRQKSLKKLKDAVREKTKRTNGHDLLFTCSRLSRQLRGWFSYFRHCRGSVFRELDGWIRGRLRSMLRRRQKRRGRGRGTDHQRWPNRFFDEHGLLPCKPPIFVSYNPHRGNTINWRAGCGKFASPVRREGGPGATGSPYPYPSAVATRPRRPSGVETKAEGSGVVDLTDSTIYRF